MPLREVIIQVVRRVRSREPASYRWFPPKHSLALTFEYVPRHAIGPPDEPPQSPEPETVASLFLDVGQLYWVALASELGLSVKDLQRDEQWAARVEAVRYGSPFHILVEVPPSVWASGATAFIVALAAVFGAPYKAGAKFHGSRADYYRKRLDADDAQRQWIESRRRAHEEDGFRLVDVELPRVPPADE